MKNQFLFLSLICAFALLFTSCGKNPEKTLPSKDGKWTLSGTYTTTTSITGFPNQVSSGTDTGTATFTSNSVTVTDGSNTEVYSWSYADDKITLTNSSSGVIVFDVTSASSKKEVWHHDQTDTQTTLGITTSVHYVADWTLTR